MEGRHEEIMTAMISKSFMVNGKVRKVTGFYESGGFINVLTTDKRVKIDIDYFDEEIKSFLPVDDEEDGAVATYNEESREIIPLQSSISSNLNPIQEALLEQITRIRNGDGNLENAKVVTELSTAYINAEKLKVETAKLIVHSIRKRRRNE